jgi:signal transduction histidine kinase
MKAGSLKIRLLAAAAIAIALALLAAGLALATLFEQQVDDRIRQELNNDLLQLAGAVEITKTGQVKVSRELADPRFVTPFSGKYWTIERIDANLGRTGEVARSRSLWDVEGTPLAGGKGPEGEALISQQRNLILGGPTGDLTLRLTASVNSAEVSEPLRQFKQYIAKYLSLIGLALIIAAWLQVSIGLKPLETLRKQLSQLKEHGADRIKGDYPVEVQPLVTELNDVLELRDKSLARARHRAGNMAHGLMTPLTVITAISRDLKSRKLDKISSEIDEQVENMRQHVERDLVRARLSSGRGHDLTPLKSTVDSVMSTLKRLPKGEDMEWVNAVSPSTQVPLERKDLLELLGNLLDNARKYGKSRVEVSFDHNSLMIDDDGPGVPAEDIASIRERGQRLDESRKGFGLGLSIVEDIADIYDLNLDFGRSPLGGLRVQLGLNA